MKSGDTQWVACAQVDSWALSEEHRGFAKDVDGAWLM